MAHYIVRVGNSLDLNMNLDNAGVDVGLSYVIHPTSVGVATVNQTTGLLVGVSPGPLSVTIVRTSDGEPITRLFIQVASDVEADILETRSRILDTSEEI